MCKIVNFNFNNLEVRTTIKNKDVLFCLVDVNKCLNLSNPQNILKRLDTKGVYQIDTLTDGGNQKLNFINEPNLYRVIFRSDKPEAKSFQNWVFEEVLPQLRKTGSYSLNQSKSTELKTASKQLNQINLTDFTNWQYYYMNDPVLSFPYFRYKIHKDTKLPLINLEDYRELNTLHNHIKPDMMALYMFYGIDRNSPQDFLYFNDFYELIQKNNILKEYVEQFRAKYKEALNQELLRQLSNPYMSEDYEQTPSVEDYMNLIGNEKLLTATEIGARLGISACMVGKIANRLNLKIEKFGAWFRDKAAHSIKEVQVFKYNSNALNEFKKFLGITDIKLLQN